MRIGVRSRSSLETPLNWVFSSEANVRILRELVLSGTPLAKSEIARRSGISLPGVVRALPRLLDTGVVEQVGTGGRQLVAIRDAHPLSGMLDLLFRTEALQKQQLTTELTQAVTQLRHPVRSAWIDESGRAQPSAPATIGVLTGSAAVSDVQDELRERLAELSARFGVSLELSVMTAADISALPAKELARLENVVPVYGPDPVQLSPGAAGAAEPVRKPRTHADREGQSLRRAHWIVRLLDHDPALPQRASSWIVHRLHTASPRETSELIEWLNLLRSAPISTLQYLLLRADERSARLRQTNPFIMALSPQERTRMVRETAAV